MKVEKKKTVTITLTAADVNEACQEYCMKRDRSLKHAIDATTVAPEDAHESLLNEGVTVTFTLPAAAPAKAATA